MPTLPLQPSKVRTVFFDSERFAFDSQPLTISQSSNVEYYRIDHLESVQHDLLDLQEEDEMSTFVAGASELTDEGNLVDAYVAERRYVVEEYKAVSTADLLLLAQSLTFEQLESDIDQILREIKTASRTDWRQEYQERQM